MTSAPVSLESTLFRVVAGSRTVGLLWMLVLGVITLSRTYSDLTLTVVGLAGIWAVVSLLVYRSQPSLVVALPAIGADLGLAVAGLLVSGLGPPELRFAGGLPLVSVAIAAIRSRKAAWLVAALLLTVVLVSLPTATSWAVIYDNIGQVIFYVAGAFIFGWVVEVLRRSDRARESAETALARSEEFRVRAEERAEFSRHIHDSVLQSLALIQRQAESPDEVVALARGQERDLRQWLFGARDNPQGSLVEALEAAAKAVEDRYRAVIEVVAVGDRVLEQTLPELVAATREAMVNAAVHGGGKADVYVEIGGDGCTVFVRDRGPGFDLADIPGDRGGVRQSIIGRMERIGGTATLRSDPRRGAEWKLEL